jgi:hypothetical protein
MHGGVLDPRPDRLEATIYRSLDRKTPIALLPVRLETRWFAAPDGRLELRARIYPDHIHVAPRRTGVDPVERDETMAFHRLAAPHGPDDPAARDQRARLDAMFGAPRARWLVLALTPRREGDRLVFPEVPVVDADETVVEATVLPDRFALVGLAAGQRRFVAWGSTVPRSVAVGPFGAPEHELRWQTDFLIAESIGLAVRTTVDRATATSLSHLLVLGVREDQPAPAQSEAVAALLERHSAESGATLLPAGTPTSHTEVERAGAASPIPDEAIAPGSDGGRLARALGVSADRLRALGGAGRSTDALAGAMNVATWPATWGYFLDQMLGDMIPDAAIERGRQLFRDHVRARGPFPTLCVGEQPYGILPVSSIEAWRRDDGSEDRLAFALRALRGDWRAQAGDLPRVGRSADPLHDLAAVLATSPIGLRWLVRGLVPEEVARSNHGPFDLGAAVNDILDAMNENMEALALTGIGLVGAPNLLDMIFNDQSALLGVPLVAPGGADREAPLASNYLRALAAPPSVQAIRDHAITGSSPRTILYLLLRHATLLAIAAAGDLVQAVPRAERRDARVRVGTATATVWDRLSARVPAAPSRALGDALILGEITTAATAALGEHRAALARLADVSVRDLEQVTAESLDAASHRLDAWITGLATERLFQLRAATPEGLYAGAWCLVSAPPPPADPVRDGQPIARDPRSRGFLHAPSLHHARTAAALRAGFLARQTAGDANPTAIDLSSDRVRDARWLIDGVRAGRSVNELLGHRIERWLTDAREGVAIATLRESFPLAGSARGHRLDGLAVHAAWRQQLPGGALAPIAARLLELVDAAADLLLAEAVHQHAGGNPTRARAALEVLSSGTQAPSELEVVCTPVEADHVEWRVLLALPAPAASWPSGRDGVRAIAHPELSAWAAGLLGDPGALRFAARVHRDPGALEPRLVSVVDLDLGPLDLVALAGEQAPIAALEALARDHLGDPRAELAPESALVSAIDTALALRRLLEGARPLEPRDVTAEPAASPPPAVLDDRLAAARAALESDLGRLEQPPARRRLAALLGAPIAELGAGRAAAAELVARVNAAPGGGAAVATLTRISPIGRAVAGERPPATELGRASERTAWLHDHSRVRSQVAALEQLDLASRAIGGQPLPFTVWAPSPGLRLIVLGDGAGPALRGYRLDAWTEATPRASTTTGLSFHYDAPGSRAPQVVLLVVPPVPAAGWSFDVLEAAILETEELARLRLVPPNRVHGTYLPAIYLAENLEGDTVSTDLRAVSVDLLVRD